MNNEEKILAMLEKMQGDIEQIKEDTSVTRETVNALVDWADQVAVISQVRFPVKKDTAE